MQSPNTPGVPAPKTFPIVDPSTGHVIHVAVVRSTDGQTQLVSQPMPTVYSAEVSS